MKKLLLVFISAFTATFTFAQTTWTVNQNLAGSKTFVTVPGGFYVPNGLIIGNFADTTALNATSGRLYEGLYADVAGVLHRRTNNTWIRVVPFQFNPIAGSNISLTGTYPNITFNSITPNLQQVTNAGVITTNSMAISGTGSQFSVTNTAINKGIQLVQNTLGGRINFITNNSFSYIQSENISGGAKTVEMPNASGTMALSVNGNFADVNGNITIATGGSMVYPSTTGIATYNGTTWGTSITDNSTNWNTAFTDRFKWDGGATGLVAATGRTSLGLGTLATQNGTISDYLLSATAASTYSLKNIDSSRLVNSNLHAAIAKAIADTMTLNELTIGFGLSKPTSTLLVDTFTVTSRERNTNDSLTLVAAINTKQATLVSGTNLKTINGNSLLGSGDLTISGGGSGIDDNPQIKLMQGLGSTIKAENFPAFEATTSTALNDGQARFWAIYLAKGQTITGISYYQTVQGNYTADASNQVALYVPNPATGDLTQVAVSANDGTNLWKQAVNTTYKVPFTSTYSASAGVYYVALLYNSSAQTTAPTILARSGASNAAQGQLDNTGLFALSMTLAGQTSLSSTYNTTPSMASSTTNAWVSIY